MTPPFLHPYLARLLTALWLGVVPLLWIACVPETALESQFSCPSNGSVDTANRRVCRDGLWERLGDMDTVDMDPGTDACISPSEAELCADQAEQKCETQQVRDACGKNRFIRCKRCEVGQECSGGTMCEAVIGCETAAQVCKRLDVSCGVVSEVLTNCTTLPSVNCGGCQGIGENCNESSGRCECVAEAAQATCQRKSNACGMNTLENNCGQMVQVDCGGCAQGDCLSDGTCSQCQEETVTGFCARLGRACGPASGPDACTKRQRSEECGSCANDRVCSNSGQCDCPVPSCQGLECGPISNRCGQTADCPSSCGANEFCASNQCQCTPETKQQLCAAAGRTCGDFKVTDRCGKSREPDCGGCPGGQVCRANQGVCCTPRAEAQLCSDNNLQCGTKMVTDNCGVSRMVNCGMNCPGPYNSCNLATNQCQCNDTRNDAQLCMAKSFKCGMASVQDGCNKSRTVNCGNAAQSCTMPPNTTCSGNQCVCVDARTDTQLCVDQNACGMTMLTDNCGFPPSQLRPEVLLAHQHVQHDQPVCLRRQPYRHPTVC